VAFTEGVELQALLDRANRLGLVHTEYAVDRSDSEDQMVERRVQDVEPILELNKTLQADWHPWTEDRELVLAARVPFVVAEQWARERNMTVRELMVDWPEMRRRLEDPGNRFLRVWTGKL
jgi:hypothetical protein